MWDTFPAWVRKKSYKTQEKKCDYQGREHIRTHNDYGNPMERMEQWWHGDVFSELCIWEILTEILKKYKYRPDIYWWSTKALCWLYHPYSVDVCIQIHSCVWIWMYCDMQHVWRSEDNAGYWSLPFIFFAVWSIFFCSVFVYWNLLAYELLVILLVSPSPRPFVVVLRVQMHTTIPTCILESCT